MRRILIGICLCFLGLATAAQAETNTVELSGLLYRASPKQMLKPYYLEVTLAGGGTQKVLLDGKSLEPFSQQIAISGGGCVPVRVTGHFKAEWKAYAGTAQPTVDGWLIWMEVMQASDVTITRPAKTKDNANQPSEATR